MKVVPQCERVNPAGISTRSRGHHLCDEYDGADEEQPKGTPPPLHAILPADTTITNPAALRMIRAMIPLAGWTRAWLAKCAPAAVRLFHETLMLHRLCVFATAWTDTASLTAPPPALAERGVARQSHDHEVRKGIKPQHRGIALNFN